MAQGDALRSAHACGSRLAPWRDAALRLVELPNGHFRRQAPIGPYVADFAHHGLRVVIELDGEQHGKPQGLRRNARRTAYLAQEGYCVVRFWNHEVAENLDGVVETILAVVSARPPTRTLPTTAWGEGSARRSREREAASRSFLES